METYGPKSHKLQNEGFKSYYVVWKLFPLIRKSDNPDMFKSYYVVWKHTKQIFDGQKEKNV